METKQTVPKFTEAEVDLIKTFFAEELSRKGGKFFNDGYVIRMWIGEDMEAAVRKHADGGFWAKYRDEVGGYSSGDIEKLTLQDALETAKAKYLERKEAKAYPHATIDALQEAMQSMAQKLNRLDSSLFLNNVLCLALQDFERLVLQGDDNERRDMAIFTCNTFLDYILDRLAAIGLCSSATGDMTMHECQNLIRRINGSSGEAQMSVGEE